MLALIPASSQLLATPTDLWEKVMPKHAVTPAAFDPGDISEVIHTGTGGGLLEVTDLPIDAYRVTTQITQTGNPVATVSAVAVVRAGASVGLVEVDGTPAGTYNAQIQIMVPGAPGVAQFRYSLNGGASWSVNTTIPAGLIYSATGTGLRFLFNPIGTPAYLAGDLFTFTTLGLGKFAYCIFALAPPIEKESTGGIFPVGMPTRPYRITAQILTAGALGVATFRYNINGGTFSAPIITPVGGTFVIPNIGISLTFDPGLGPIFFGEKDLYIFRTWGMSKPQVMSADPIPIKVPVDTGLRFTFVPPDPTPGSGPHFIALDTYSFSSTASWDVLSALQSASDDVLAALGCRYRRPLLAWDQAIVMRVCEIARLSLFTRKGLELREDKSFIDAEKKARAWLLLVARKELHPAVVESEMRILVPMIYPGPDPHKILEGTAGTDEYGNPL